MKTGKGKTRLSQLLSDAQLPAMPQSAIHIIELSRDPGIGPAEFAVPIEADPGLTGQVLRFVNSSYFGFRHQVASVKSAITLVGVRTIKNFALWSAVFGLLPDPKCGPFDLKSLWQDSLRRGIFSRAFGKILGLTEADDLFAASLLQDMAIPLLAKAMPAEYRRLLESRNGGTRRLSDLEREEFAWTHAEAGGLIARHWRLPESIATRIQSHIGEAKLPIRAMTDPAAATVVLSSWLPSTRDASWPDETAFSQGFRAIVDKKAPPLASVFEDVDSEFTRFAPILNLPSASRALSDFLIDKAGPVT